MCEALVHLSRNYPITITLFSKSLINNLLFLSQAILESHEVQFTNENATPQGIMTL